LLRGKGKKELRSINVVTGGLNMESETVIKYKPFKEIVIMECNRFSTPDDLARFANIATGGKLTGVYWAEGVAFIYYPLPASTEIAAKSLIEEKRVYWAFVNYALMPEHRPTIETKERIIVPVIDMSTSPLFQKVAKWLKNRR
jgi:hypothetical protein